ncbi:hypothetical protein ACFPAF_20045 [Hymenobacter endophyticus]|uniref:STAS/SEC14 domain-containing protein n=1 Tax=Hymenobacter endophyticus TaxID=3076335 RepID=A0ABU3TMT9_9BACT|nr:hypothetical protein [Hymenobacter endophyticus]MDU0372703.1 hypothetical protein [Hymenobacter endophyticus]
MLLTLSDIRAQFDPEAGLLRFQWAASAGRRRFQRSMSSVAQLLEQGDISVVLLDLHGLPSLGLDEQLWLAANWLSRVSVRAIEQVALVIPPDTVYNQMVVESLIRAGRHFMRYEIQFFSNAAEALDWLVGEQNPAAQVALEQEWQLGPIAVPE